MKLESSKNELPIMDTFKTEGVYVANTPTERPGRLIEDGKSDLSRTGKIKPMVGPTKGKNKTARQEELDAGWGRRDLLKDFGLNSRILYQGTIFEMREFVGEGDNKKYKLVPFGGKPVYKLTREQLIKAIYRGDAKLVPLEPITEILPETIPVPIRHVEINFETKEFIIDGKRFLYGKDIFTIVRPDRTTGKVRIEGYHQEDNTFSVSESNPNGKSIYYTVPFETFLEWQKLKVSTPSKPEPELTPKKTEAELMEEAMDRLEGGGSETEPNPELLSFLKEETLKILSSYAEKEGEDLFNKFTGNREGATFDDLTLEQQEEIAKLILSVAGIDYPEKTEVDRTIEEIKNQIEIQKNEYLKNKKLEELETVPEITEAVGKKGEKITIGDEVDWNYLGVSDRGKIISFKLTQGIHIKANIDVGTGGEVEVYANNLSLITPKPAPIRNPLDRGGIHKIPVIPATPSQPVVETLPKTEVEKIRERMMRRAQEIAELREALEQIKSASAPAPKEIKKTPEIDNFSVKFLQQEIKKILTELKAVKNVKTIELIPYENEITLVVVLRAKGKFAGFNITTDVTLNANIINKNNSVGIEDGYSLTATKGENSVRKLFNENMASLGEKIKEYIEKGDEKKRKIEKMEIVNGKLKITYK